MEYVICKSPVVVLLPNFFDHPGTFGGCFIETQCHGFCSHYHHVAVQLVAIRLFILRPRPPFHDDGLKLTSSNVHKRSNREMRSSVHRATIRPEISGSCYFDGRPECQPQPSNFEHSASTAWVSCGYRLVNVIRFSLVLGTLISHLPPQLLNSPSYTGSSSFPGPWDSLRSVLPERRWKIMSFTLCDTGKNQS